MQIIEEGNFIKIFHNDQIYQKLRKDNTIYVVGWEILKEYNGIITRMGLSKSSSEEIEQEYQKERTRIYRQKKLERILYERKEIR